MSFGETPEWMICYRRWETSAGKTFEDQGRTREHTSETPLAHLRSISSKEVVANGRGVAEAKRIVKAREKSMVLFEVVVCERGVRSISLLLGSE